MAGVNLIFSTVCNTTFCDNIYDNPLLDSQVTAQQNETLALINELNGKHLVIATYNNRPLSWVDRTENNTLSGQGVAFVIIDILREMFNFTYEVVVPTKNYEFGGRRPEESLVGLVNSSKVDLAAAFIPVILKYKKQVTYSIDLDEGLWSMMLKRPKESAAGSGLLAPFDTYVWYLILAAVLLYGPCITFLTRVRSRFVHDEEPLIKLSPSVWFVYGAFIKQGTTLSPDANTTRVLFATWWLFVILLSAFYTANLTAFLTLSKFTLDIESPKDLYKKNYRWVAQEGSAVEYSVTSPNSDLFYLNKMVTNGRAQFHAASEVEEFLPVVKGGAVLVKELTAIESLMYGDYLSKAREGVDEAERCTYVMAPNVFMKQSRAFAFPKNSTLISVFDSVIIYLLQSGIITFLEHKDMPSTKICPLDLQSKDRQLRNSDLMMTYMIMFVGLAVAITVFITEVLIRRYIIKKSIESKNKTRLKDSKRSGKLYNPDDSRPPPYDSLFGKRAKYKITENSERKIINGREYWVVKTENGDRRLVPVRTPSALLYR